MSWERKWKEFQTADRLDEAVGKYDPTNPVGADTRDDELAFNTAVQKKADAKKARTFGSLNDATAAKANDAFRLWLNKEGNEEQKEAVVAALKDDSKTKTDPTIGKRGRANNHFKAAWQVAGAAFVGAAMSEGGLSDDVAAKLGDFGDTIGGLKEKEVEFEKVEATELAKKETERAAAGAQETKEREQSPAAQAKRTEKQTDIRQGVERSRTNFIQPQTHDPNQPGDPPLDSAVAGKGGTATHIDSKGNQKGTRLVVDPIGATGRWLKSKLPKTTKKPKKQKPRNMSRAEAEAAGVTEPTLGQKLNPWSSERKNWVKSQKVDVPDSKTTMATSLATDAAKKAKEEPLQENISFEKKWKNYQRIVESTSKAHLADNEFQQKMKSRRSRNNFYTKPSGAKDTSKSAPFSKKVKHFGKSNTYFENMNEAEQEVLDSFELQNELNPASFAGDKMIPEIRERLMEIAQDFLDGIDFKMDVEDITLTGSLANYNWSKYSDFDLHILVDYEAIDADQDLVKRFFQDIKAIWNIRHNIFLKGYEVEVYVQNTNEDHMSSGVYSVQNDEWVLKPEKEETERDPVDKQNIEKKADDIIFQIDRAEKLLADGKLDDALAAIDRLKQKVRNLRKIGLSKEDGVYSVENLAFKTLRRSMELERLSTLKNKAYDRQMSITQ